MSKFFTVNNLGVSTLQSHHHQMDWEFDIAVKLQTLLYKIALKNELKQGNVLE